MDIADAAWSLVSAVLGVIIGAWVARRMMFSTQNIMEYVDSVLSYLMETKEGNEKLYRAGFLLGKALKDGVGFGGKAGKGGIKGAIEEGIAQFISKGLFGGKEAENPQQPSKQPWEQ